MHSTWVKRRRNLYWRNKKTYKRKWILYGNGSQRSMQILKRLGQLTEPSMDFDDLSRIDNETGDLSEANAELETLRTEKEGLQDEKYKLAEQSSYHRVSAEMLKDTGIKTKIIKQYIPVINKLTNEYLISLTSLFTSIWMRHSRKPFGHDTVTHSPTTHSLRVRNNGLTCRCCSHGDRLPR